MVKVSIRLDDNIQTVKTKSLEEANDLARVGIESGGIVVVWFEKTEKLVFVGNKEMQLINRFDLLLRHKVI